MPPPVVITDNSTCDTFNIFVGDLTPLITGEDLREAYDHCGPITSATVIRNRAGESKCMFSWGYGLLFK